MICKKTFICNNNQTTTTKMNHRFENYNIFMYDDNLDNPEINLNVDDGVAADAANFFEEMDVEEMEEEEEEEDEDEDQVSDYESLAGDDNGELAKELQKIKTVQLSHHPQKICLNASFFESQLNSGKLLTCNST